MNGLKKVEYPFWVNLILILLRGWLVIYDLLAYLPFKYFASPKRKLERSNRLKAKPLKDGDPSSPYRTVDCPDGKLITQEFPECDTLDKLFERAFKLYGDREAVGSRDVISVDQEKQPNGRIFEKYDMSDYNWLSYDGLNNQTLELGSGLLKLNHKVNERAVIFAETREEWITTAVACFRYKIPIVTVYPTLGEEAIAFAINESEAPTMFTSQELVKKVLNILPRCPSVRRLVYYESRLPTAQKLDDIGRLFSSLPDGFRIMKFKDILDLGAEKLLDPPERPKAQDLAMIMYTSGTTGLPKGVLMTHRNVVAANAGEVWRIPNLGPPDVYIAYLPLAHIFELVCEIACLTHGVKIGYSSALTLTDNASKVKRGAKGDATVLRPTFMACVPAIMDRLFKTVVDKVNNSQPLKRALFDFVYELKRSKIEDGYDTPFLNRLVFNHIHAVLGGRVRFMLSGGAPLNPETQRFMNICFCCPIGQGYGLTETVAGGTCCDVEDLNTGRVGPPVPCCDIMLREWQEGGYSPKNKPFPQGEVLISGANVSEGYLNNPQKTAEDFININGRIWFCTGDIGLMLADGTLKIIDRKKDLLKLKHGEYISLTKVEATLQTCPLVDNICVYGNSDTMYTVALVVPNKKNLEKLGAKLNVESKDFESLRTNKEVCKEFLKQLQEHAKQNKLDKMEIPEKLHLCKETWTVELGLLTDAMKLKRKPVEKYYADVLNKLYAS